jgi:hypothetical protein
MSMSADERDQYLQMLQGTSGVDPSLYTAGDQFSPGSMIPSPDYGGLTPQEYDLSTAYGD